MRLFGFEITRFKKLPHAVYFTDGAVPVRVYDLSPDEARLALVDIITRLQKKNQVAFITKGDIWNRIRFRDNI